MMESYLRVPLMWSLLCLVFCQRGILSGIFILSFTTMFLVDMDSSPSPGCTPSPSKGWHSNIPGEEIQSSFFYNST